MSKDIYTPFFLQEDDPEDQTLISDREERAIISSILESTIIGKKDASSNDGSFSAINRGDYGSNLCCGYCCDVRRVVFMINAIQALFGVFLLVICMFGDGTTVGQDQLFMTYFGMVVAIAFPVCGIHGALRFKRLGIIVASIPYAFSVFVGGLVILLNGADSVYFLPFLVLSCLHAYFLYVHIRLLKLLHVGMA